METLEKGEKMSQTVSHLQNIMAADAVVMKDMEAMIYGLKNLLNQKEQTILKLRRRISDLSN